MSKLDCTNSFIEGLNRLIDKREAELAAANARIARLEGARPLMAILEKVYEWQRETFPSRTPASIAAHLLEEAGELANDPTNSDEMADVAMLLSGLVRDTGTDLAAAIRAKLARNRERDWTAPPNARGYVKARPSGDPGCCWVEYREYCTGTESCQCACHRAALSPEPAAEGGRVMGETERYREPSEDRMLAALSALQQRVARLEAATNMLMGTVALLNSMVRSGEDHSPTSERVMRESLDAARAALAGDRPVIGR